MHSAAILRLLGRIVVVLLLGFIILPAVVVAIAAFNDRALLAFPPEGFSLRWFIKAFEYRDFQTGFHNGLIVTLSASAIAVVIGTTFAFALDRYRFAGRGLV